MIKLAFTFSAQFAGLLCEEEGNGADNVQYCGYCKYHFSKLVRISFEFYKFERIICFANTVTLIKRKRHNSSFFCFGFCLRLNLFSMLLLEMKRSSTIEILLCVSLFVKVDILKYCSLEYILMVDNRFCYSLVEKSICIGLFYHYFQLFCFLACTYFVIHYPCFLCFITVNPLHCLLFIFIFG